jgi:UDP-3-O-[3-hydroxymyristoyl] glucosamine N-acyltransferase
VLAGCTGIAGSVTMGEHCIVGGAGMISGHVTLAPGTTISGGSLVMKNIAQPGLYTSVFPLDTHDEWVRNAAHIRRLSHLAERVSELEKKLKEKGMEGLMEMDIIGNS